MSENFVIKGVRLDYIHAERPLPITTQQFNVVFNVSILGNVNTRDNTAEIPFVISVTSNPPVFSLSLKGVLLIEGSNEVINDLVKKLKEGKVPDQLQAIITQFAIFEASLLARELGLPPIIPIQVKPQQIISGKETDLRYV